MLRNDSQPTTFFNQILTSRQLLTRWIIAVSGGGCIAILAPVLWINSIRPSLPEATSGALSVGGEGQSRPIRVSTSTVAQAGPSFLTQRFTGIVKPRRSSLLAAKSIGRVEDMLVEMGDSVESGQLLILLDRDTLEAERNTVGARLAAAQAQLEELRQGPRQQDIDQAAERVSEIESTLKLNEANLQRTESLVQSASISRQELDEATFTVEANRAKLAAARHALDLLRAGTRSEQLAAAEANVRGLEAELEQIAVRIEEQSIFAPYAGKIQTRMVDEGAVVSPGQSLLQIVEAGALEIHVGLPPELAEGLSSNCLSVTTSDRQVPVEIARLSPAINEATRTREVVLTVPASAAGDILLGNAVNVEIRTPIINNPSSMTTSFWIPRDALTAASRGLWAVFIAVPAPEEPSQTSDRLRNEAANERSANSLTRYKIERRQVELLRSQGEWTEVRGPIGADERLVVEGGHRITQGQIVVIDMQ